MRYRYLFIRPNGTEPTDLGRLIEEGRLDPAIDRVFPFEEIKDAFAYLESGRAKGKVVVGFRNAD